jgi:pimeloyl-ACP methyl ester carboxylesterase
MRIEVDGTCLFFDVEGPGTAASADVPTLILVHGGPGFDHSPFKPAFSSLSDVARVVYLDLRGHGRSDPVPPTQWTLSRWSEDIKAFCDALGIERPILLGQSFGGFVVMAYATKYPTHPRALILASTAARTDFQRKFAAFERIGGPEARRNAEDYWLNPNPQSGARYMEKCLPLYWQREHDMASVMARVQLRIEIAIHFASVSKEMTTYDFREQLARIRCPTLITVGDMDPITPVEDSEEIFAHLPAGIGRLETFRNCGHGVEWDSPREAMALMREFINAA